ncbi:R-spondin-3-like [Lampris incognitus]|uniref:R-spondin-3-like n=1 Tax=Lampris incognitus TaxID=2546036 RepID=UPI0024B4C77D|nr:R-spondin-3-like [Lampris incognitus]
MDLIKAQDQAKILRGRRSSVVTRLCQAGCVTCSALNGCLSCKPRLFFHLELDGMRQRGVCLSSCPHGHYGMRTPPINICTRCTEDCASCFNKNFCTRCHPGHFLFRGRCEEHCPEGLTPNTSLRECTECPVDCELCVKRNTCNRCRADLYFLHGQCHQSCPKGFEPDVQLMECTPQVHCEVGEWGEWSPCVHKGSVRAYRKGKVTRTREILQLPSLLGDSCPHISERKKCLIKKQPRLSRLQ